VILPLEKKGSIHAGKEGPSRKRLQTAMAADTGYGIGNRGLPLSGYEKITLAHVHLVAAYLRGGYRVKSAC